MPVNKNGLTKEMIAKAMQCKTAEDLMALAKSEGAEITKGVAGGSNACWHCLDNCGDGCPCRD